MIPNEMASESENFIFAVLLGFVFGMFFEVFRLIRVMFPHKDIAVFIEDLLFFVPVTASVIIFLFVFTNGVIRLNVFMGIAAGGILYFLTLGKVISFFSKAIISFIKKALRAVARSAFAPVFRAVRSKSEKIIEKSKKVCILINEKRSRKKDGRIRKKILKDAKRGFGIRIKQ